MHVDWSAGRFLPVFQPPRALVAYTVRGLAYDLQLSIATLTGIINREHASVYLDWREFDLFWLRKVLGHIPSTLSTFSGDAILFDLLDRHGEQVAGYVIYNPTCSDSVNVASMLGAQRNGFVVSPKMADLLLARGYHLPVIDDLRKYTWHSRAEVYRWSLQHLFAGATPGLLAGLNPATALGIRPYLVASRAFIYWLHPLAVMPKYIHGWQSERQVLKSILRACPVGSLHLGWFLQEGSGVTLTSQHAIPVVASDYFSNLETWSGAMSEHISTPPGQGHISTPRIDYVASTETRPGMMPERDNEPQAQREMPVQPWRKVYVSFTMSEGDNLQYLQEPMLRHWRDPRRGSIPIGWPMALILRQAAPALWNYYCSTASVNDEFLAGPSGLAYSYPSKWPRARLTPYLEQTGRAMQQMHMTSLEILESNFWLHPRLIYRALTSGAGMALVNRRLQRRFARELQAFGLQGILSGGGQARGGWRDCDGVPILQNVGIASSVEQTLALIRRATSRRRLAFLNVYVLAWQMGPTELSQVARELGSAYEIVTPGTLLKMVKACFEKP